MFRLLLTFLVGLVGLGTTIQIRADDDDDDRPGHHSRRFKDEQKRQDKYFREQQKREREFFREQHKREEKEAREQAKRQRELFDRDGDDGRLDRDRYAGGDYAKQLREERKRRDEFLRELDSVGEFERSSRGFGYSGREYGDIRGREFRSYSGGSYYGRPDYRYGDRSTEYGYRYSGAAYSSPDRRRSYRFYGQFHIESGCSYPPGW